MNLGKIGKTYSPQAAVMSRIGAGSQGTLSNWSPRRINWSEEGRQREKIADRANDIVANNAHGASIIDSIAVNTVGTGIWPQAKPNFKRLGITQAQAQEIAELMEFEFEQFAMTADATAVMAATATSNFYGIQFQNLYSLLVNGEFINIPAMISSNHRRYSLALQTIDPVRLRTPLSLIGQQNVRDGIKFNQLGQPVSYFVADPEDGRFTYNLDIRSFKEIPSATGHRPNIFHRFVKKSPEQVRGVSILAPAMKFFRDMADYMDFELVGAIVASSFPVWIEKTSPFDPTLAGIQDETDNNAWYQEVSPGQVYYGNVNEKPHVLSGGRPGQSFAVFIETILRAVGAATGMPYEVVAKDFSRTNYSSARAALEEAWRVFGQYQDWLISYFCQPIYEMVFEEAFLKGYIRLPKGSPDFYQMKSAWCAASWIVPERTQLDPVKEMSAAIMGINANLVTAADVSAKRGKDWESQFEQRAREIQKARELDLPVSADAFAEKASKKAVEEENDETN